MTQHQFPLSADLATDIILYPTSDELRNSPDDPLVFARARRGVNLYFHLLQAILVRHGQSARLTGEKYKDAYLALTGRALNSATA